MPVQIEVHVVRRTFQRDSDAEEGRGFIDFAAEQLAFQRAALFLRILLPQAAGAHASFAGVDQAVIQRQGIPSIAQIRLDPAEVLPQHPARLAAQHQRRPVAEGNFLSRWRRTRRVFRLGELRVVIQVVDIGAPRPAIGHPQAAVHFIALGAHHGGAQLFSADSVSLCQAWPPNSSCGVVSATVVGKLKPPT